MDCAMKRLRFMLSEGRVTQSETARKFARGDHVFVNGAIQQNGTIVRVRDSQYTVKLANGRRCYVYAEDLRDVITMG